MKVLLYIFLILNLDVAYILGKEYNPMEGKIVGGDRTDIKNFPHAVFLSMECGGKSVICGSSVVNQVILLTAAHCLQCKESLHINAQAGDSNLKAVTVVRKARSYKSHPYYSEKHLYNDIGLLLLAKALPLGSNIKRVIIKTHYTEKASAYVAGWGISDDQTRYRSPYLKMVKVPLQPGGSCLVVGRKHPGMLCAGTTHSEENRPSRGDSGSALITSKHQQIGIVSFRTEPHIAVLIYTNVSYYHTWIKKTAKQLYCSVKH